MRSFSKKLAFVLAAAMVFTAFAPAAKAEAAAMKINKSSKILYVTDGEGINDAAQVGGGKGNVAEYDFSVSNKPKDYKKTHTFEWSSSDEDVIEVGKAGLTKAVGVGVANVVCVVTEKATGKATTLKSEVTVKANAAEVVITNADDYADLAYEVGAEIDLNRAMYDAEGKKAPKRGVKVTDYTRWMVEPSAGVKVTQSNGKYVFTDEAEAGTYKLWCETYQSSKYTKTTAKSQVIEVELVKEKTFEVAQNSLKKFTVKFDSAVDAFATEDVTVERIRVANGKEYKYNQLVKTTKLADDKKSATVEMFANFTDATNYEINIKGFDAPYTMTASVGKPVDLVMTSNHKLGGDVVSTNVSTEIKCTFYDANGIDVTDGSEVVIFRLEKYATDGSYYLANNNLTIKKEGVDVVVKADYQGYLDSNNKRVGQFSRTATFFALNDAPIVANGVDDYTLFDANGDLNDAKWGSNAVKSLKVSDKGTLKLYAKIQKSNDKKTDAISVGGVIEGTTTLAYEAINKDVCSITENGILVPYKPGTASFYVNAVTPVTNAQPKVEPFAVITIDVKADSVLDRIEVSTSSITVGDTALYDDSVVKVTSYDQHGAKLAVNKALNIKCLDSSKKIDGIFDLPATGDVREIKFDGSALADALKLDAGKAGSLEFEVEIDGKKAYFTVTVQRVGDVNADYVEVVASTNYVDASRTADSDDTKKLKELTFEVFTMNNNVKRATKAIKAHPGDGKANEVSPSDYVYKITKNGNALTDLVTFNGNNKLTVALSGEAADSITTTSTGDYTVVDYSKTGAGVYVFELYKCVESGNDQIFVLEKSVACTAVVDSLGAYYIAGDQKADTIEALSNATILDCFMIKDRSNNEVKSTSGKTYEVAYTNQAGTGVVYVDYINFYEKVADGVYAVYKVTIDTVLNYKN